MKIINQQQWINLCLYLLLCIMVSGCMVGPDFHKPHSPCVDSYTAKPIAKKTVSAGRSKSTAYASQQFEMGESIPRQWWALYHSHKLNQLIEEGLAHSPNLEAAEQALRQAKENLNSQIGSAYFPSLSTNIGAQRQFINGSTTGVQPTLSLFDIYNVGFAVNYTLDVFGGLRRATEGLRAQVDYNAYLLRAAYLTLTSNIVTTTITIASLKDQVQATQQLITEQTASLKIVRKQYALGGVSYNDVLTQESQLANLQASLPPLQQGIVQNQDALAVLLGILPSQMRPIDLSLKELQLPIHIPISCPSSLVHRRPDILASEAQLHVACAQVGVATANMYPQITISGNYGWDALNPVGLFKPNALVWNYGGQLVQPIFNGGALTAAKRAAEAAFQQAAAQYRQTVLQAFGNVSDGLRALQNDAKTLQAQRLNENATFQSLRIVEKQYRLGGVSYLNLLIAEQQYQQAKINRIKAEAARFADTAGLFQALGGGWQEDD